MGGGVFSPALHTPRMPPEVYFHVRDATVAEIRRFYRIAETPIEAPSKSNYGDIDILAIPKEEHMRIEDVAGSLRAKEFKSPKGSLTTHFAIPWPKQYAHLIPNNSSQQTGSQLTNHMMELSLSESIVISPYIQVDLHVCPTPERLEWELFQQAHGDLWNMLGGIIRPFGLTLSHSGFYVRVEQLESRYKKHARVKLTETPDHVLKFLGLDAAEYWNQFESLDAMMSYAATCRFHNPARGADKDKHISELPQNDRQRVQKRPTFAYWVEEYLPLHRKDSPGAAADMSREEVVQEAKDYFGSGFAEEFERTKAEGMWTIGVETLWATMRKEISIEGQNLGYAMKGIKREVVEEAEGAVVLTPVQRAYKVGDFQAVISWAKENGNAAGMRQKALDQEKSRINLLDKVERDKKEQDTKGQEVPSGELTRGKLEPLERVM